MRDCVRFLIVFHPIRAHSSQPVAHFTCMHIIFSYRYGFRFAAFNLTWLEWERQNEREKKKLLSHSPPSFIFFISFLSPKICANSSSFSCMFMFTHPCFYFPFSLCISLGELFSVDGNIFPHQVTIAAAPNLHASVAKSRTHSSYIIIWPNGHLTHFSKYIVCIWNVPNGTTKSSAIAVDMPCVWRMQLRVCGWDWTSAGYCLGVCVCVCGYNLFAIWSNEPQNICTIFGYLKTRARTSFCHARSF